LFFRLTPKQRLVREIDKTIKSVNEGNYRPIREQFSPEFIVFLSQQNLEPQQILLAVRQFDMNQGARYTFRQLTLFEESQFAEAEFIRKAGGEEQVFLLPFIWRDGKWWITDHFKSDHQWDTIQGM
jgi:hypothetical protein